MAKPDTPGQQSFEEITGRLDEIVRQVRDRDVTLERSLDLFDEAIALGSKAIDLVDTAPPSDAERTATDGTKDAQEGA